MAILDAIDGLVTFVGHSIEGLAGWRYLLSPSYRKTVHARWARMDRMMVAGEIFTFLVSFVFVSFIIVGGLWLGFSE
jgi:hypothetical protein